MGRFARRIFGRLNKTLAPANGVAAEIEARLQAERAWTKDQIKAAERRVIEAVHSSTQRTHDNGQARCDPLATALREIAMLRWSVKLIGVKFAKSTSPLQNRTKLLPNCRESIGFVLYHGLIELDAQ